MSKPDQTRGDQHSDAVPEVDPEVIQDLDPDDTSEVRGGMGMVLVIKNKQPATHYCALTWACPTIQQ